VILFQRYFHYITKQYFTLTQKCPFSNSLAVTVPLRDVKLNISVRCFVVNWLGGPSYTLQYKWRQWMRLSCSVTLISSH